MGNPAETPYLSVRDGKLSNAVRLVEFRPRKVAVHTFLGSPKPGCSDGLRAGTIESHDFFISGPVMSHLTLHRSAGQGYACIVCDSRLRKIVLHTCSDLFKPVQTCSQISDHVRLWSNFNFPLSKVFTFQSYVQSC